ncbi:MAG: DMT family transporter [Micropruina glycogenica]
MTARQGLRNGGVRAALLSAALFGASAPLAKLLLGDVDPWLLAGLLYVGAGVGMGLWRIIRRSPRVALPRGELWWLVGAVVSGGLAGPVLLMVGLASMPASGASLLLNVEGVLTAVIAWVVFREPTDRRVVVGMLAIVAGAVVIAVPTGRVDFAEVWPALAIVAACACWALDNNLTRKVSLSDATWLVTVKGCTAGATNLGIALLLGAGVTSGPRRTGCDGVGLRRLRLEPGAVHRGPPARRHGARRCLLLDRPVLRSCARDRRSERAVDAAACAGGGLMALGTWLHVTERHSHGHTAEAVTRPLAHA